jgi:Caspase recruitment domain
MKKIIETKQPDLCQIIAVDSVLLRTLCDGNLLTPKQRDIINDTSKSDEKVRKLLRYCLNSQTNDCFELLTSFEEAGQKHVVNFIVSNGGRLVGFSWKIFSFILLQTR